jgi:hypothetical protein
VWVDRLRRRPIMIAADLGRALLLLSIPLAYLLGHLAIGQLYAVAALAGALTVFFDVAYQTYLPALVEREQLVEGNSKLGISGSIAEIAGPPLGGALVQLISGPVTILLDAASFLFSAVALCQIRAAEPPAQPAKRALAWGDLTAGLRTVWADKLLRPMAISSAIRNFFGWFFGAIYGLYAIQALGMGTAVLGLTIACGGLGSFLGALLVVPATRRFGYGWATIGGLLVGAVAGWLTWLAGGLLFAAVPLMIAGQILGDMGRTAAEINTTSLRQSVAPEHMLGRVNASTRVLAEGVGALGLLAGGLLAEAIGLRATVAVAVLGALAGDMWLIFSPLRKVHELPQTLAQPK